MGIRHSIIKIRQNLDDDSHWITRRKLTVFGATLIAALILLSFFESVQDPKPENRLAIIDLPLPERVPAIDTQRVDPGAGGRLVSPSGDDEWESVTVRPGQTLDAIFRQQGFPIGLLHEIMALNSETKNLKNIRPGDVFDFQSTRDGEFMQMRCAMDEANYLLVRREGDSLAVELQPRDLFTEVAESEGVIQSSLFTAGKKAGLSDAMVMNLANIFGWDIDFVLDIRKGDRFVVVYEKLYRDGEMLRDGRILAATFINQGERFQAVYFEDADNAGYFAPDGRNMRKAFLRAPLNFSYISSGFQSKTHAPRSQAYPAA